VPMDVAERPPWIRRSAIAFLGRSRSWSTRGGTSRFAGRNGRSIPQAGAVNTEGTLLVWARPASSQPGTGGDIV
jgi:hypothetical protein